MIVFTWIGIATTIIAVLCVLVVAMTMLGMGEK